MIATALLSLWMIGWSLATERLVFTTASRASSLRLGALAAAGAGCAVLLLELLSTVSLGLPTVLAALAGLAVAWFIGCSAIVRLLARFRERDLSVQRRLVLLSVLCALAGLAPRWPAAPGDWSHAVEDSANLVLRAAFAWCAARAFVYRYREGVRAASAGLARVERGDLEVRLDPEGSDEIAQVSVAFNRVVEQLRRVEFLEQLNEDLQRQSEELRRTLKSLEVAQKDLVRAERMASVATLVRGIAHELNNPIGYIAGNMPILKRYCDFIGQVATRLREESNLSQQDLKRVTQFSPNKDLDFVCKDLEQMSLDLAEGARRAQLIIGDLHSLTSAAQRHFEDIDVRRAVEQSVSLLSSRLPLGARIELDLEDVPPLRIRAGQLEQVLVNLIDNARRAVGRDGRVRLAVRRIDEAVQLTVEDDGCGMSEDVRARALEPFFTTRGAGEGSGLGLAIADSIVRAHHGTLEIQSSVGSGTRVNLRLPLPEAARA